MGGSAQAGRGRTAEEEEEEETPFSLEEVRDEYLFLVPEDPWAPKPLSLRGLVRLLEILDYLFEDTEDRWDAVRKLDEKLIAELLALLIRQSIGFVTEHWNFKSAANAVAGFWASPERRYLTAKSQQEPTGETDEREVAWVTSLIERLSYNRGWTADQILDLPFLAALKLLEALDERAWDERTEMIMSVERGVGRAVASALGKGDSLPQLPSYRQAKRKIKEAEVIRQKGQRFFAAAVE